MKTKIQRIIEDYAEAHTEFSWIGNYEPEKMDQVRKNFKKKTEAKDALVETIVKALRKAGVSKL